MKEIKIRITFTEELLGTANSDADIHERYIASRSPNISTIYEEVKALENEAVVEEAMTVFPKENGVPFMWDYQWKGYLKDASGALRRVKGTQSSKMTAYKKLIDKLIFPQPRKIFIKLPKGQAIGSCLRPLRGQTAQGEVVAFAKSETCPIGSQAEFSILLLDDSHENWIKELLDYGKLGGTGQWRNSGKGRFTVEYLD